MLFNTDLNLADYIYKFGSFEQQTVAMTVLLSV